MLNRMMAASLIILVAAVPGCSDDPVSSTQLDEGFVRVAHLSPDAPSVDVWVDGAKVLDNVPFEAFSTYLAVPAGDRQIQVTPAGATTPVVIDATLPVTAGDYYTVAATGYLASIAPTVLIDDVQANPNAAKVRFVHASPDAPAVDITLADGTVLFGDVAFGQAADFLTTPGGTYDLQVRAAGTDTVVLTFNNVPLQNETIYSVFATGLVSDGSLGALVALDDADSGNTTVSLN